MKAIGVLPSELKESCGNDSLEENEVADRILLQGKARDTVERQNLVSGAEDQVPLHPYIDWPSWTGM